MNIFVLSLNVYLCAKYHCDKHVVKMIVEYGQMLCTTHHLMSNNPHKKLFKKGFVNHPCTIWVRQTTGNYSYLYLLFCELCREYTFRYSKIHSSEIRLKEILNYIPERIPEGNMTIFAQAMPDIYKHKNSIIAYRNYYINEKKNFCKWSNREIPYWFIT